MKKLLILIPLLICGNLFGQPAPPPSSSTPSSTEPCCSIIYLYGGNIVSQSTTFSVVNCSNNTSSITVGYNETYILPKSDYFLSEYSK